MICVPIPCFGFSRLAAILLMVFWVWTLVDCARHEPEGRGERLLWLAVILLAPVFGAAFYVLIRRPQRIARYGR